MFLINYWLVVWTPLKNISQFGWLFPIYGKIKNVPNHQPDYVTLSICFHRLPCWSLPGLRSPRLRVLGLEDLHQKGPEVSTPRLLGEPQHRSPSSEPCPKKYGVSQCGQSHMAKLHVQALRDLSQDRYWNRCFWCLIPLLSSTASLSLSLSDKK